MTTAQVCYGAMCGYYGVARLFCVVARELLRLWVISRELLGGYYSVLGSCVLVHPESLDIND